MLLILLGTALLIAAFCAYCFLLRAIWQLVSESRQAAPGGRFHLFYWMPAWTVHRVAYPASDVRRRILVLFAAAWVLGFAGLAALLAWHLIERR